MRSFVFGLLGVLVGAALVAGALVAWPRLQAGPGAAPNANAPVRRTADEVIRAFNAAGLRTDNPQPLAPDSTYAAAPFNARKGRAFTVGAVPPQSFSILEFDGEAERDAVRDQLAANRSRFPHRFSVKDNIILVSRGVAPDLAARYETVLAALR